MGSVFANARGVVATTLLEIILNIHQKGGHGPAVNLAFVGLTLDRDMYWE